MSVSDLLDEWIKFSVVISYACFGILIFRVKANEIAVFLGLLNRIANIDAGVASEGVGHGVCSYHLLEVLRPFAALHVVGLGSLLL